MSTNSTIKCPCCNKQNKNDNTRKTVKHPQYTDKIQTNLESIKSIVRLHIWNALWEKFFFNKLGVANNINAISTFRDSICEIFLKN